MLWGHNYDFESYLIVGDISSSLRNVYAETYRYNYGFIFSVVQGILYGIASFFPKSEAVYRFLIVSLLTITDFGIYQILSKRYSLKAGLIFFLNPVSVFITGFHNQFDNIVVLLALLMSIYYNEEEKVSKKDALFVLFFFLGLTTKHILFLMPLYLLLRPKLPVRKKLLYALVAPLLFALSFVPFVVNNEAALYGVLGNVFLYKSSSNAPLLSVYYNLLGVPDVCKLIVFIALMSVVGFASRKMDFDRQVLVYTIALVALSSAISNQYLAIPLAALSVLCKKRIRIPYTIVASLHLILDYDGLALLYRLNLGFKPVITLTICAWILLIGVVFVMRDKVRES